MINGLEGLLLSSLDAKLALKHLFRLCLEHEQKLNSSHKSAHAYIFYKDSNAPVMVKMVELVTILQQRIVFLLNECDDHPALQKIVDVIEMILAIPLSTPLVQLILFLPYFLAFSISISVYLSISSSIHYDPADDAVDNLAEKTESLSVSDGLESTFSGLKKKKKKSVHTDLLSDEKESVVDDLDGMFSWYFWLFKLKGFMGDKYDNSSAGLNMVARPRKGERLHKQNMQCGDGSKYMSYIKVSKEQHQLVRSSMKNSSNSIQSRSLNHVLGNLYTFHVQPFEVFEKEERKKLHEHWLQLVNRDLPVAFANWRTWQIKKWQMVQSLDREIEENLKSVKEILLRE